MDDLYLILHKVRGQPAFDVATKITIGDEEGWIIPTSGHRAYPWLECKLRDLDRNGWFEAGQPIPEDWPDHYAFHNLRRRAELRPVASKKVETEDLAL